MSRANADAVRAVYDDLSTTQGPSAKTRAWAVKLRYAPPAAWDDGDMDDPYAIPAPGYEDRYDQCAAPGCVAKPYVKGLCERHYLAVRRGATLTAFNDVDMVFDVGEWAHLVRGGVGPAEAAVRCGGTIDMVEHRATEDQDVAVLRLLASAAHDAGDFNRGARLAGLASAAARATRDAKAA